MGQSTLQDSEVNEYSGVIAQTHTNTHTHTHILVFAQIVGPVSEHVIQPQF